MTTKHLLLALLTAALVACNPSSGAPDPVVPGPVPAFPQGAPTGEAVRLTVGSEGGTFASADGRLSVQVPPGALTAATELSVQPITNTAPHGGGGAYRLGPAGVTFKQPVQLTFRYGGTLEDAAAGLVLAGQDRQGAWQAHLGTTQDRSERTLTARADRFGDWAWAEAYRLHPGQASVKVGQSVKFTLMRCVAPEPGPLTDDLIAPLISECTPYTLTPFTRNWAVNGTAGGSATQGTVVKDDGDVAGGTYTAPAQRPDVNPVAVSVDLVRNETGINTLRLVSTVQVLDEQGPCREVVPGLLTCQYALTRVDGHSLPYDLPKQSPYQGDARDRVTGGYLQVSGTPENLARGEGSYEIRYRFDNKPAGTDQETHRELNDVGSYLTNTQGTETTFTSIGKVTYTGLIQAGRVEALNFPMATPVFTGDVKLEFAP